MIDVADTGILFLLSPLLCPHLVTLVITGYNKVWDEACIRKVRKNAN